MDMVIIGGSRGLGRELSKLALDSGLSVLVVSRRASASNEATPHLRFFDLDLSNELSVDLIVNLLETETPKYLIYCAGGGPHGEFEKKEWKDHRWSLQVSLLSPLKIMHTALQFPNPPRMVFIGSEIAENKPEPLGASYCASKRGLRGAIESYNQQQRPKYLRLYSPPYMKTDLLPKNSIPITQNLAVDPKLVAQDLINWMMRDNDSWHRSYPS